MVIGGEAIVEALPMLEEGILVPEKQNDEGSCYASLISKGMGEIDFTKSAVVIDRLIRGMNPWPSAYTFYKGKQLKLWRAVPVSAEVCEAAGVSLKDTQPGAITEVAKDCFSVATGDGVLKIYELQLEGKKRMSTHDFLLGVKPAVGELLGER
jgi:methionyl-tRNA formyltransferase